MDIYDKIITAILVGIPLIVAPPLVITLLYKWRRRQRMRAQAEEKTRQHLRFMQQLEETRTRRRKHQLDVWNQRHHSSEPN